MSKSCRKSSGDACRAACGFDNRGMSEQIKIPGCGEDFYSHNELIFYRWGGDSLFAP